MTHRDVFLLSDAALRDVVQRITPDQLDLEVPAEWTSMPGAKLRNVLNGHARDEAWVPDVVAGKTLEEVGDAHQGDLLGDDPIASYNRYNDLATAAVEGVTDLDATAHLSYGDFPLSVFLEHTSFYRAFQAWSIGHFLGFEVRLPDALVDGLTEILAPQVEQLRAIHVFGPAVEVPADADAQTKLLGITGFWRD